MVKSISYSTKWWFWASLGFLASSQTHASLDGALMEILSEKDLNVMHSQPIEGLSTLKLENNHGYYPQKLLHI